MLKDYWGNEALDFGEDTELESKYADKIFVSVSNKPFGKSYVLFICEESESEKAQEYLESFSKSMRGRGITAFGAGIGGVEELKRRRSQETLMGGFEV
ncbi:MAG: hypothetical protein FWH05_02910 [Oscillospiraceae bacterium]|nr:hypothetical protein [Oscillospiraceae bacterium]